MPNSFRWKALLAAVVFGISFGVYLATLAPSITWRNEGVDGGDLATAVHTLGIAHPPGYPTYVLLGWLFHWLPLGDTAFRLNIMSAFWSSLSAVLVYLTVLDLRQLLQPTSSGQRDGLVSHVAAASAALALAFSSVLWSQATIAEVYTLNAFFVAAVLFLLTRRLCVPAAGGALHLPLAAGLFGLGLGNHLSLVWLLPPALLLVAGRRPFWRQGVVALFFLVAGLAIYAYLPLTAGRNPPVNWGYPTTWPRFLWLVSADIYRRFAFALPLADLPLRLVSWLQLMGAQFYLPGLALGMVGLAYIWRRRRSIAVSGLLFFVLIALYAVTYDTTDSYLYLIPAFMVLAIWLGCGLFVVLDGLLGWLTTKVAWRRAAFVVWVLPFLLPAALLLTDFSTQNLSADHAAYSYAEDVFSGVESNAIIVADSDDRIFALTYYRYVVDSQSAAIVLIRDLLGYRWYQDNLRRLHPDLILASDMGDYRLQLVALVYDNRSRPIYTTSLDPMLAGRFQWTPRGPLFRLPPSGRGDLPVALGPHPLKSLLNGHQQYALALTRTHVSPSP